MQNQIYQQLDWRRYASLFWKRKWLILLPILLFPVAVGYYSIGLQDQFKSTTLILIQPQKVPAQFVPTTVTTSIEERIQTISQQIFSRTRLEQIMNEFNLFQNERKTRPSEEITELMRRRIELKVHRNDAFQLSFVDSNPRLAMLVTNKLASSFIEENLKVREQQAAGTSQFLADEIERYREKVHQKEKIVYEFRQNHMNEMPEQLTSNQSRLSQLQNQLQINTQNVIASESRRVQFQQQLMEIEKRVAEETSNLSSRADRSISDLLEERFRQSEDRAPSGRVDQEGPSALQSDLEKRKQLLERMLLTQTERHPDVVRLKAEIAKLERGIEEERQKLEHVRSSENTDKPNPRKPEELSLRERTTAPAAKRTYPPIYDKLKSDIAQCDAEIKRLSDENREIRKSIEMYQARIGATPERQLQLQQLSEDYGNLKAVLESLINKKLQADLSENLERKQKGEQFMILDPANLPEKPFYPRRMAYLGGALAFGLAIGVGIALLLDLLDSSVKSKEELTTALEYPVLGVIPEIVTASDLRRRMAMRLTVVGAVTACALITAGVVHFKVKPIPRAVSDLYAQVRATHWNAWNTTK